MSLLRSAIFALASAGLVYVSRAARRRPYVHGFWRFWAWEAIVARAVLNAPVWFRDPLAWYQLILHTAHADAHPVPVLTLPAQR